MSRSLRKSRCLLLAALISTSGAGSSVHAAAGDPLGGLGILGDSSSDEFRADDARGGQYAATTLGWVELLVRYRSVDAGPWGQRAEPRRAGYAYNWARSGAVAADIVESGQVDGLAAQVAAGQVSTVAVMVGANDFALSNDTYAAIYDGRMTQDAVQAKIDGILSSLRAAVRRIRAAGSARIFIATLVDRAPVPAFQVRFPEPARRERITRVIEAINDGIREIAHEPSVHVVDVSAYGRSMLKVIRGDGTFDVDGEPISVLEHGDEPHHMLLGDNEHGGTVGSGLLANVFIDAFRQTGLDIAPFSPREILQNAGIDAARPRRAKSR
ncbi:MAG: SGNH/GDSL hydrolase family protein [Steroidobacteraceae bacterium]